VTTDPSKSTPRFSVVVTTLPLICSRDADRASSSSPSARRMPAAAIAAEGLFLVARAMASSKVTRSIGAGVRGG
jgi:hypothetical protein